MRSSVNCPACARVMFAQVVNLIEQHAAPASRAVQPGPEQPVPRQHQFILHMRAGLAVHRRLLCRVPAKRTQRFGQVSESSLLEQMKPEIQINELPVTFIKTARGLPAAGTSPPTARPMRVAIAQQAVHDGRLAIHDARTAE